MTYGMAVSEKIKTRIGTLSKYGRVISINLLSGIDISIEDFKELISAREMLADEMPFASLMMLPEGIELSKEVREYIASIDNPNWIAVAIITDNEKGELLSEFYIKVNQPKTLTKVFDKKSTAIDWLNRQIN
jgi:hypothetical protein